MNTTQLSVLFAALSLLGYVFAAPVSLSSDLTAEDHPSIHEIEQMNGTRYEDPLAPKNKKCMLRSKTKQEARDLFVKIVRDISKSEIATSVEKN